MNHAHYQNCGAGPGGRAAGPGLEKRAACLFFPCIGLWRRRHSGTDFPPDHPLAWIWSEHLSAYTSLGDGQTFGFVLQVLGIALVAQLAADFAGKRA